MKECPFCNDWIIQSEIIIENDLCLFLQREEPVLLGSGLIIPRAHRESTFDLTPAEWNATYEMLHQVKKRIDLEFHPDWLQSGMEYRRNRWAGSISCSPAYNSALQR